uniref:Uncharacterized protein n=1 Tax=Odontella aurita TaxID=265563 RepID=A0A7S4IFY0_9STRA|mmetsp:Transcript_24619/g.71978  ORF Transcript_24619/g.71978 Transcript_24619/m.71978 type:complete len:124 (+) Transcript_24619:64-435(+)
MRTLIYLTSIASLLQGAAPFSPLPPKHLKPASVRQWASSPSEMSGDDSPAPKVEIVEKEGDEYTPQYGVSYIGGDPCGSKYNDDPFDASTNREDKPGMPDSMKSRIDALVEKMNQREAAESDE